MKKLSVFLVTLFVLFSAMPVNSAFAARVRPPRRPIRITQPVVTEPVVTEPVVTEPVVTEPVVTEPVVTEPIVTEPEVTEPTTPVSQEVNVKDFGAKGDGISDDTSAIQKAINEASSKNVTLTMPGGNLYGYESTGNKEQYKNQRLWRNLIHGTPAVNSCKYSMVKSRIIYSNVTIEGLTLKSQNTIAGTDYYANSMISNVQGMFFQGISNLTIKDVAMDSMYVGHKNGAIWKYSKYWNYHQQSEN
jgi:Endopolygalacturonase